MTIVSDADQQIAKALEVLQRGAGPGGADVNAPTNILVDGQGTVRWLFRPDHYIVRLSPEELLAEIDRNLPKPS